MRSEEELTHLFTDYFGDRLSSAQIDHLVTDVRASAQNRAARTSGNGQQVAPTVTYSSQPASDWRPEFAF